MGLPKLILTILLPALVASRFVLTGTSLFHPNLTLPHHHYPVPSNPNVRYFVECERVSVTRLPGLNPTNLRDSVPIVCEQISLLNATIVRGKWQWVDGKAGAALGYYFPINPAKGAGEVPDREQCERNIYGAIVERCAYKSWYNVGSINVAQLPTHSEPGIPMTVGYPRYIMAPRSLTRLVQKGDGKFD